VSGFRFFFPKRDDFGSPRSGFMFPINFMALADRSAIHQKPSDLVSSYRKEQ
jgi:hypothetical protein